MDTVVPSGVDIRNSDISVGDGFLQESINLQIRDGSLRPIPERIVSDIDVDFVGGSFKYLIFHKVADEDKINVLGFFNGVNLEWFGSIVDGVFEKKVTSVDLIGFPTISDINDYSFTIVNGVIYFMSTVDRKFLRVQYDVNTDSYSVKDMYAWKDVSFKLEQEDDITYEVPGSYAYVALSICGIILIRFAFVLKTGEVVKHSAMYPYTMYGVTYGAAGIVNGDPIKNIHTYIPFNLSLFNSSVFNDEIAGINIYASIPRYNTEFAHFLSYSGAYTYPIEFDEQEAKGAIEEMAKNNFYLVKTITAPDKDKGIVLYAGGLSSEIDFDSDRVVAKINTDTIAAGEVMPVDDFSHHKLFGELSSYNGNLIIKNPTTELSKGYLENFTLRNTLVVPPSIGLTHQGYDLESEDGELSGGMATGEDYVYFTEGGNERIFSEAILSYPDYRANKLFLGNGAGNTVSKKLRSVISNYLSCALDMAAVTMLNGPITKPSDYLFTVPTKAILQYDKADEARNNNADALYYNSENRAQFSAPGEFSVFPVELSNRIGQGKIIAIGTNSVDPGNADIVAPLIVGATDGVYSINLDPTGTNLVASITKIANVPCLSKEILQIDTNLLFVSDKGLITINNGRLDNLTRNYFPDQGQGAFPTQETVYPNYNAITAIIFGGNNPYIFDDVVNYLKGALLAYDGRRNNIWCCNPTKNYSMVYNIDNSEWSMSMFIFDYRTELYSTLETSDGDVYSRFIVMAPGSTDVFILSGEDNTKTVDVHLLTRPIKFGSPKAYKRIEGMAATCELIRKDSSGYFYFGAWGKQDMSKNKVGIPIAAILDGSAGSFPGNIRENIPLGTQKGKYKALTLAMGGRLLPESTINNFEFIIHQIDELKTR